MQMWIPNIDVDPDADLPISKSGPAFANLSRKLVIGKWESYNYEEESLEESICSKWIREILWKQSQEMLPLPILE